MEVQEVVVDQKTAMRRMLQVQVHKETLYGMDLVLWPVDTLEILLGTVISLVVVVVRVEHNPLHRMDNLEFRSVSLGHYSIMLLEEVQVQSITCMVPEEVGLVETAGDRIVVIPMLKLPRHTMGLHIPDRVAVVVRTIMRMLRVQHMTTEMLALEAPASSSSATAPVWLPRVGTRWRARKRPCSIC